MEIWRRWMRVLAFLALLAVGSGTVQVVFTQTAQGQAGPGATIETHHESIPNPVFGSDESVAATCRAAASPCEWNDAATWLSGSVPGTNSRVIIDGQVVIGNQEAIAHSIGVYPSGELSFAADTDTRLQVGDLLIVEGGALEIGTAATPIANDVTAEIVFRDLGFDADDPEQHLRGLVAVGGTVRMHGRPLTDTYLRTATEPQQGAGSVTTARSMAAAGWRVGDTVTIPTSRQCAGDARPDCASQTEDRTIVDLAGTTATLDASLSYAHPGARDHDGQLDFTPHVINKSRNVVLRSENPDGVRGHLLFHGRANVDVRYVEVRDLGRTNIDDLGGANQKGRYPVHAHHLIGPQTPQPNGYQFSFVGNVVDFGQANASQDRKWGIAIHGSHFGLIEQNIVDHASGAAIVTEDGSEMGNMFRKNFVVRVIGGNGARTEDTDPGDGTKLGRAGVGYWFNGGGRNFFERNVAADIGECVYCYGYKFDNVRNGDLVFPVAQGTDPYLGGGETVSSYAVGINHFVENEAYAVPNGLTVWWACTFGTLAPDDSCSSRIESFHLWHHHRWGYHGYPVNNLTLADFVMRGDASVLTNRYERTSGMNFSDYMHRNLVIEDADIQNVQTAIDVSSLRDLRGVTGPDVGVTTVEGGYLVATEGLGVWAPASVNRPSDDLPPQTLVVRNVRFDYPNVDLGDQDRGHIVMHDTSVILSDDKTDYESRNDVWIDNYNEAPGVDGDDLYIVATYQGPSRCDDGIGVCDTELTAAYDDIVKGHVYALRDDPGAVTPLGDVSCDGVVDAKDALMIAQYLDADRTDVGTCPLTDPSTELNAAAADITDDGQVTSADTQFILQCSVGLADC